MSDRRISLVFEGSEGASRFYMAVGCLLQEHGFRVSIVGPVDYHARAQHLGLAYVAMTGLEYKEILAKPGAVAAMTEGSLPDLVQFLDAEQEHTQEQSLHALCQALKGYEPGLILCSSRPLHYVMAIGNALCLPVLQLTFQSLDMKNMPMVGDYLDQPSWYGKKENQIQSFLQKSEVEVAPLFAQWLGTTSKFWPTVQQLMALAGPTPDFPLFQVQSLPSMLSAVRKIFPDRYLPQPKVPELPPNVFEVLANSIDGQAELGLPEFSREESRMIENLFTSEEPPVLITFGYLNCGNAASMTQNCVRALYSTQLKGIFETGLAGLSVEHLNGLEDAKEEEQLKEYCKSNVVFVKNLSLARTVSRASLVVHDGSTFLANLCIRHNRPQLVLPVFGEGVGNAKTIMDDLWIGRAAEDLQRTTSQWLEDAFYRMVFEQDSGFMHQHKWGAERGSKSHHHPKSKKLSSFTNYRLQTNRMRELLLQPSMLKDREEAFVQKIGRYWETSISSGKHLQIMEDLREFKPRRCWCCGAQKKRVHEEP